MKTSHLHGGRRWPLLLAVAIMLLAAVACGQIQVAFDLQRVTTEVQTGPSSDNLTPVDTDDRQPLPTGDLVTTDDSGEAILYGTLDTNETCEIHIFRLTDLLMKACPKSDFEAGIAATCQQEGDAVYKECKNHVEMTPSGEVRVRGSWIEITYISTLQMTLVIVLEGQATVQPVLAVETRKLGSPVAVLPGQFFYTSPDNRNITFSGVPARTAVPLQQLPVLIENLQLQDRMKWVGSLAGHDKLKFSEFLDQGGVFLRAVNATSIPPLERDAILRGVRWTDLIKRDLGDPNLLLRIEIGDVVVADARTITYDPRTARANLDKLALNNPTLLLYYQRDDRELAGLAKDLAASLAEIGLKVELVHLPLATTENVPTLSTSRIVLPALLLARE